MAVTVWLAATATAIAIALGLKPLVLLLDEPAAGVPSVESHRILEVLDALPKDMAILIIGWDDSVELLATLASAVKSRRKKAKR